MIPALFAYLHHLAAFTAVGMLVCQHVLLRQPLTVENARKLVNVDMAYGVSAVFLVGVGFTRVFNFEKGAEYYFHSLPFLIKIGLAASLGAASAYPTLEFLSWRKGLKAGQAPDPKPGKIGRIKLVVTIELLGIGVILLCAALMAKGVGFFG